MTGWYIESRCSPRIFITMPPLKRKYMAVILRLNLLNDHLTKVDWMLESFHFPRGPSMYGIHYQQCAHAISVNMFKNRIDKYLVKAGYT